MSNHDEEQDQPWTEEQWEKFLKTADLRAARYGELMETLIDDPDRDEIIDKEMGWEKEDSDSEELLEAPQHDIAEAEAEAEDDEDEIPETELEEQDPGEMLPESVLAGRDDEEFFDSADRQLHRLPSYHLAEKLSKRIDELLVPHMKVRAEDGDDDVAQAFIQIKIASAKIAGGHQMGYHDEVLGGNVVNCKRALDAAQECRTALEGMLAREVLALSNSNLSSPTSRPFTAPSRSASPSFAPACGGRNSFRWPAEAAWHPAPIARIRWG